MNLPKPIPSQNDHADLLEALGPLPLSGQAWSDGVRILNWVVLAAVGMRIISTVICMPPSAINTVLAVTVIVGFLGVALIAWYMQVSITTIDDAGVCQTWITRRKVAWQDIQIAKFVPLLFSKRLVVFTRRGRPVVFQGGTRDLHLAFAKISLRYRRP
jgi:hypothetical protein